MKELVEMVARGLVDRPEDVQVTEVEEDGATVLELRVDASDLGKVIGKRGRTARAVRTVLAAAGELTRMLENAVAGSVDVPTLLRGKERSVVYRRRRQGAPVIRFDNDHSRKYTVLELVADDAPGLLHKVSRAISGRGCDVDLVLIATEGKKAVDVLHITRGGKKLNESDQVSLRDDLERMLEDTHEAR